MRLDFNFSRFLLTLVASLILGGSHAGFAQESLENYYFIDTSTPARTLKSYLEAMNKYNALREKNEVESLMHLDRAVECFDLESLPAVIQKKQGREAAILLKEVLDRLENFQTPEDITMIQKEKERFVSWKVPRTHVFIELVMEGPRKGEYLFSEETLYHASEMYNQFKDKPYREGVTGAGYKEPFYQRIVPDVLKVRFFFIRGWQWIGLLAMIGGGFLLLFLVRPFIRGLEKTILKIPVLLPLNEKPSLYKPISYMILFLLWSFLLEFLQIEGAVLAVLVLAVQVLFSISAIWAALDFAGVIGDFIEHRLKQNKDSLIEDHMIPLLKQTVRIALIVVTGLVALQSLGINVMGLVAGLGLGGLAFALAAKDTAANIFGSLTILLDRPFKVGDWILIGDAEGTVEEIGLRSTRIRTFYDSLITIPNSSISMMNIDNYGSRKFRRIKTTIGVTYDTPPEKIEAFLEGIKNIIKANPATRKDYFHVVLTGFGPSSLDIMLYLFVEAENWSQELVERQNIYLEVMRFAKEIGVDFAFPTQTLHVASMPESQEKRDSKAPEGEGFDSEELRKAPAEFGPKGNKARPGGLGFFVPPYKE